MKSLGILVSLLRFHLRFLPWYIWPLLGVILLLTAHMTPISLKEWTIGGYNTTQLMGPGMFSFIFLAAAFCRARSGDAGGLMPAGEFLLTRSVLRPAAYFSRMALYFIIILAAPVLEVYVASAKPDLRVEFFDISTQTQSADASAKLRFYQGQFPEASLVHETKPNRANRPVPYDTLVIPSGALLIARWDLFISMIIALTLQMGMFSLATSKFQNDPFYGMFTAFGTLIIFYLFAEVAMGMMYPQDINRVNTTFFEHAFFYFAHRGLLLTLFALEGFVLIQWIALKRIQRFEVI